MKGFIQLTHSGIPQVYSDAPSAHAQDSIVRFLNYINFI